MVVVGGGGGDWKGGRDSNLGGGLLTELGGRLQLALQHPDVRLTPRPTRASARVPQARACRKRARTRARTHSVNRSAGCALYRSAMCADRGAVEGISIVSSRPQSRGGELQPPSHGARRRLSFQANNPMRAAPGRPAGRPPPLPPPADTALGPRRRQPFWGFFSDRRIVFRGIMTQTAGGRAQAAAGWAGGLGAGAV